MRLLPTMAEVLTLLPPWYILHFSSIYSMIILEKRHRLEKPTNLPSTSAVLCHIYRLGINIEIKYPINPEVEWLGYSNEFELNAYLDTILSVVFACAGDRRIFFSCFHAGMGHCCRHVSISL
jgi:glycerophosphoryl diester phosphodiesterase